MSELVFKSRKSGSRIHTLIHYAILSPNNNNNYIIKIVDNLLVAQHCVGALDNMFFT